MTDFARNRRQMVDCQLRTFDVTDRAVLAAMDEVPRELFVEPTQQTIAYADGALAVANGRAILLPPMVLGRMIQGLEIDAGDKVLVVGGATGYGAAVLAQMGASVVLLEESDDLSEAATRCLASAGAAGIEIVTGQLERGWASSAPYDAILIEGGFRDSPTGLLGQLADGRRLVGVDMSTGAGKAVSIGKVAGGFGRRVLFDASAPVRPAFEHPAAFAF